MISAHYNKLVCVNKFSEGSAPAYEPSYALQDEFYSLMDTSGMNRIWTDRGSVIRIDSKMYCDADVSVTTKDIIRAIELHPLVSDDLGKYHKEPGGAWTLTASAAIGTPVAFYGASTNTGTGRLWAIQLQPSNL